MKFSAYLSKVGVENLKKEVNDLRIDDKATQKAISDKFKEIDKLFSIADELHEANYVGNLNRESLLGKSVDLTAYPNPNLYLEKGDIEKIRKHIIYNNVKLNNASSMDPSLGRTKVNLNTENYTSALQTYIVTVEGLGDMMSKVWEKIKNAIKYVIEKIKKFFRWITGNSEENSEASKSIESAKIDQKDANKTAAAADQAKASGKNGVKNIGEAMTKEQYIEEIKKAYDKAIADVSKLPDVVTENELVTISNSFSKVNLAEEMMDLLKNKAFVNVSGVQPQVYADGTKKNADVKIKQYKKDLVKNVITDFYNRLTRTRTEKLKNAASNAYDKISNIGSAVKSGAKAIGGAISGLVYMFAGLYSSTKEKAGYGNEDEGEEYINPIQAEKERQQQEAQKPKELTEEQTIMAKALENIDTATVTTLQFNGPFKIYDIDVGLDDIKKYIQLANSYFDKIKKAVDTGKSQLINKKNQQQQAKAAQNGKEVEKAGVHVGKDNTKKIGDSIKIVLEEGDKNALEGIINSIIDKNKTIHNDVLSVISKNGIVLDGKVDLSNVTFKCVGTTFDKLIYFTLDANNSGFSGIKFNEVKFSCTEEAMKEVTSYYMNYTIAKADAEIKEINSHAKKIADVFKTTDKLFNQLTETITKMADFMENFDKSSGAKIDAASRSEITKFITGALTIGSYYIVSISKRSDNIIKGLTWLCKFVNEVQAADKQRESDDLQSEISDIKSLIKSMKAEGNGDENGGQQN